MSNEEFLQERMIITNVTYQQLMQKLAHSNAIGSPTFPYKYHFINQHMHVLLLYIYYPGLVYMCYQCIWSFSDH